MKYLLEKINAWYMIFLKKTCKMHLIKQIQTKETCFSLLNTEIIDMQ